MKILEKIESICPKCFYENKIQKLDANIVEEDGKIWLVKNCQKHGFFKEIYFGDVKLYQRWMKYKVTGSIISNVKTSLFNEPKLYTKHTSQMNLTNLVVTNRCNLRCDYCFMNAGAINYVYEPTLDKLRLLMQQARNEIPIGSQSIQITGGEPTIREDFFDIIRMAKEVGFSHVQVHTNGLKLARSVEYCQRLWDEKINTVYLSFNGVTENTNPLLKQNKNVLENLRKVNGNVVLVPVLINNKNLQEAGKIVRFAIDNIDVVKGVHFQPICFCGRASKQTSEEQLSQRVDYSEVMKVIEKEFDGKISRDDFYPISIVSSFSKLVESITQEPQLEFTAHPGCGGSTFIYLNDGKPLPITRFIDIDALIKFLNEQIKKKGPLKKLRIASAYIKNINSFIDHKKAPLGFDFKQIMKDAALVESQYALRNFHNKSLFLGFMWFQDAWNLNIDRLQRCVIHYTTLEGIVPFCSYNGLGYGDRIRKKHSISIEDWEKKTGRKLTNDLYKDS